MPCQYTHSKDAGLKQIYNIIMRSDGTIGTISEGMGHVRFNFQAPTTENMQPCLMTVA